MTDYICPECEKECHGSESVPSANQLIGIKRKKLTQKLLEELFKYDDGNLIRRVSTCNRVKVGDCAGSLSKQGYLSTWVYGQHHLNHRLIWLLHHGYFPENELDHIDQDKLNNRIDNLREVSRSCNMRNTGNYAGNKSGVKGVHWARDRNKWLAQIRVNNKKLHLGYSDDLTEAVAHRLAAEQCIDWSNCDSTSPSYLYMKNYQGERQ